MIVFNNKINTLLSLLLLLTLAHVSYYFWKVISALEIQNQFT